MPLLKNLLPLRTIALRYIARNLKLLWKKEWNRELRKITKASDAILLNIPSVLRLEIFSYSSKHFLLDVKALLMLLDHKSLSGSRNLSVMMIFDTLNVGYVGTLLARRCKRSTSLSLSYVSFAKESKIQRVAFGIVSRICTELAILRLHSTHYAIVKVIGSSLHNLEELILVELGGTYDGAIKFLVRGCPKLKKLQVGRGVTLESVQYMLLGLPNLVEFKHPLMVHALERIIQDGRADEVSNLRMIYIDDNHFHLFVATDVYKSAQTVINHLINITKLDITVSLTSCTESLTTFALTVSTMNHLTELTWREYFRDDNLDLVLILKAVGHQLRLLDLYCKSYCVLKVIDQCRQLRVLRIASGERGTYDKSIASDLNEPFTPFQHLEELHLSGLHHYHFIPTLLKSLIASPVLQDLKLQCLPIFTDNILEAAFTHINEKGEQLAFTSLRKLDIYSCCFITNYLENIVSHERVPLELLVIQGCSDLTEIHLWKPQRFEIEVIDTKEGLYY